MNKEILKNIINTYEILKKRRNKIINDLERFNNGQVKEGTTEYMRILEEISGTYQKMIANFTYDDLIARACYLNLNNNLKQTSNIYLYMGTYMFETDDDGIKTIKVRYKNKKADYRWYKNIENYEDKLVMMPFTEDFEKTQKVVFTNIAARPTTQNDIFEKIYYYEAYKVQHEFVKLTLNKGIAEAEKELLDKYKKENIAFL